MSGVIDDPNRSSITAEMLAAAGRRVTIECADRDFREPDHDGVMSRHASTEIVQAFLNRPLAAEMNPPNLLRRSRASKNHGPHEMGKLTTDGWRAWLWWDDGTEYAAAPLGHTVVWMFAKGPRRDDSPQHDLEETHRHLIGDPHDTWLPTDSDYDAFLDDVRKQWGIDAANAIENAAHDADAHPHQLIDVQISRIEAKTIRLNLDDHDAQGVVIASYGFRYFALARQWANTGEWIAENDALVLAQSAFTDLEDDAWGEMDSDIHVDSIFIPWADFYCYEGQLP